MTGCGFSKNKPGKTDACCFDIAANNTCYIAVQRLAVRRVYGIAANFSAFQGFWHCTTAIQHCALNRKYDRLRQQQAAVHFEAQQLKLQTISIKPLARHIAPELQLQSAPALNWQNNNKPVYGR